MTKIARRSSLVALVAASFLFTSAWAQVPAAVTPIYAEAKAALDAHEFAEAARVLDEALAKLPPDTAGLALLQLTLGTARLRANEPEKAIFPLEKAAASDPAAIPLLADALRGAGRTDDARRVYEKAATGDAVNAKYSRARIAQLDSATEKDALKAVAFAFTAADTFAALGEEDPTYLDEATAIYEAIARSKQWRGEVQRQKKALPEAIAYYQRCFVSWTRYPAWCARAYLRASESFEALGRRPEAIAHLRELLRKVDKYSRFPEFEEAKKRLRAWGEVVP